MEKNYRIQMKVGRRNLIGLIDYTLEEANEKAEYFRSKGKKVKVINMNEL